MQTRQNLTSSHGLSAGWTSTSSLGIATFRGVVSTATAVGAVFSSSSQWLSPSVPSVVSFSLDDKRGPRLERPLKLHVKNN